MFLFLFVFIDVLFCYIIIGMFSVVCVFVKIYIIV